MFIRKYTDEDKDSLFKLMREEGEEWSTYYGDENREKYTHALNNSITYVVIADDVICGYIRCKDDDGFGIYILDLLVSKQYRGRSYGRSLMKTICDLFPNDDVYVNSDVDPYYEKQGCKREGTIFSVGM